MTYDVSGLEPQLAAPLGDVKLLVVILPSLFSVDNVKNLTSLIGTHIDQAYLGSCTDGRTEDFAIAARLLKGRKIHSDLRMVLVPASRFVLKEPLPTRESILKEGERHDGKDRRRYGLRV